MREEWWYLSYLSGYLRYSLKPRRLLNAFRYPQDTLRILARFLSAPAQVRSIAQNAQNVEGTVSLSLGILLYNTVLGSRSTRGNAVEIGAFKGASTCYLSMAAAKVGKRGMSFEIFSGLPNADPVLDPSYHVGQYASDVAEYEHNVQRWGRRDVVDLVIGDARETLLPALDGQGFSVAFVDVSVYDVMRELLLQLWHETKGQGELIIVDDVRSPGVRRAVDEFRAVAEQPCKETIIEHGNAAVLNVLS